MKRIPFISAVLWIALLFGTGLLLVLTGDPAGGISREENRTLASLPAFSPAALKDSDYTEALEDWFSDQFPARTRVISAANGIKDRFSVLTDAERLDAEDFDALIAAELGMTDNSDPEDYADDPEGTATEIPEDGPAEITFTLIPEAVPEEAPRALPESAAEPTTDPGNDPAPAEATDRTENAAVESLLTTALSVTTKESLEPYASDAAPAVLCYTRSDGTLRLIQQYGEENLQNTADTLNAYRAALPADGIVYFTFVPYSQVISAWLSEPDLYTGVHSSAEELIAEKCLEGIHVLPATDQLTELIQQGNTVYLVTDHHWNGLGAYSTVKMAMDRENTPAAAYGDYSFTVHERYKGSLPAVKGLPTTERLEIPKSPAPAEGAVYDNLDRLINTPRVMESEHGSYNAFLGGAHSPFEVITTGFHTGRNALVLGDSFSQAYASFLTPYYDTVCFCDARELKNVRRLGSSLREYITHYEIDDIHFIGASGIGVSSHMMAYSYRNYLEGNFY